MYNSSGYDSPVGLGLLAGVVDIYLPDFKFWWRETALTYCQAKDYPERARQAIAIMYQQVGDLILGQDDLAQQGLLVRHLLLPGLWPESKEILSFLAELSPRLYVNIMAHYHPCYRARDFPAINREIKQQEYD